MASSLAASAGCTLNDLATVRSQRTLSVAVVGLGYVGLPTSLALNAAGVDVVGLDVSPRRLRAIERGRVDLLARDHDRLAASLAGGRLTLTTDPARLAGADAVIVAVPTPVDDDLRPDPRMVHSACATVAAHARAGQTIILTSTTYVGTTRRCLVDPLAQRGLVAGDGVHVAFAPERILPGDPSVEQTATPRVVGGATAACTRAAERILAPTANHLHAVSSPEAAELTKLLENTFRAINLGFANEFATIAGHFGLDPVEIVDAAATKPYGFLAHYPAAGVGGHCIPVDPYYLLAPLADSAIETPIATTAMAQVAARPARVARRALEVLDGIDGADQRVLIVGMAYKPGVADHRGSPAATIARELYEHGVRVDYHDPLVPRAVHAGLPDAIASVATPKPGDYALAVVVTVHHGFDYSWLARCEQVLDATYRTCAGRRRQTP